MPTNIKKTLFRGLFSLYVSLLSFTVFGQSSTWQFDLYHEKNSSIPHNFINDIAFENQDVWIATGGGLVHWSAHDTTLYTPQNSPLKDFGIKSIAIGKNGNKYIGTYGEGIFKLDKKGNFTHLPLEQPNGRNKNTVITIAEDKNGVVWFGTEESGLFKISSDFKTVENIEKTAFSRVFKICIDDKNTKWIATERGLYILDETNSLKIYPALKGLLINSIAFSDEGKLIVSTTNIDKAELFIDGQKQAPSKQVHYQFRTILAEKNRIWAASMTGLVLKEGHTWQVFSPDNSGFPSRSVSSIAQNPIDESIWVGTFGQGLVRIKKSSPLSEGEFRLGSSSIRKGDVVRLKIEFEQGSAVFKDTTGIYEIVQFMKDNPNVRIELAGHTDRAGDIQLNYKLSQDRADAVMLFLIQKGISPSRMITKAYGGSKPLNEGTSEADRQENRRVEMKIID